MNREEMLLDIINNHKPPVETPAQRTANDAAFKQQVRKMLKSRGAKSWLEYGQMLTRERAGQ